MREYRPGGFQQLPVVVKNLIIINCLVYALTYLLEQRGINVDDYFALHYWQSPLFRWWQIFTHMFMHGSIAHIFFNMFALWMFGRILENVWGPQRFFVFYMICGIGAAFCHLGVLTLEYGRFHADFMAYQHNATVEAFQTFIKHHSYAVNPEFLDYWKQNPDCGYCPQKTIDSINNQYMAMINDATVGASGAIFGLLFAFGYLFPNTLLYLYFAIPIKAKWFVAGYAVLELYSGISNNAGDNIAHFAHLGGMLFAFIMLRLWKNNVRDSFY